ncbi:MAG: Fic family protein [Cytophagales bacterium]|nr:MAG: Fic family protein [Cytophagales bacterium]
MPLNLKLLKSQYFLNYKDFQKINIENAFETIKNKPLSLDEFKFYLANSAVHSSNIEGNTVSFYTYLKSSEFNLHLKSKEMKEIDDLIKAHQFAKENDIALIYVLKAYGVLTNNILIKKERGKIRNVKVGVRSDGRLIYLAIEPEFVKQELDLLFADISVLLNADLSLDEIFYYAALIHLVFVNIHPFVDGNGRTTRLLEKWFLSKKIGESAWLITSEKYYW